MSKNRGILQESLEYGRRHWPASCRDNVAEGEIYFFVDYVNHPDQYGDIESNDTERIRYIERHLPGCPECRGVYDNIVDSSQKLRKFVEKKFGIKESKPN